MLISQELKRMYSLAFCFGVCSIEIEEGTGLLLWANPMKGVSLLKLAIFNIYRKV